MILVFGGGRIEGQLLWIDDLECSSLVFGGRGMESQSTLTPPSQVVERSNEIRSIERASVRNPQMFGDQAVTSPCDRLAEGVASVVGRHGEVELRVQSGTPVGEVCRAYREEPIVDDHDLQFVRHDSTTRAGTAASVSRTSGTVTDRQVPLPLAESM